jgi:hypothetical protein
LRYLRDKNMIDEKIFAEAIFEIEEIDLSKID